jgi:hypothetical protein
MSLRLAAAVAMVCLAGSTLRAQSEPAARVSIEDRVSHLDDRLSWLRPDRPREYFELGEEVASEAASDADRRLARQLYALAFELSRAGGAGGNQGAPADPQLAPSACLALAAIGESDEERRWLGALAETVAPDGSAIGTPASGGAVADARRLKSSAASRDPAAFDLATMLGLIRIGEGRAAQKLLERPGVQELLDRCDQVLMPGIGGASTVRRHIEDYPNCPQCHNRRYTKDAAGVHICSVCKGAPGGTFSTAELVGHLRTESMLLSGQQRSWSGQITSDFGSTLRELDSAELAATYGVDATRPLWRGGRWAEDPQSAKPIAPKDASNADPRRDVPPPDSSAPEGGPVDRRAP